MPSSLSDILHRIRDLEDDLERELSEKRREWHYRLEANRIRFEREIREYHRRLKRSIPRFIREARLRHVAIAPLIYSVCVPLVLLDLWFTIYQLICFPVFGIRKVSRSAYFVVDRHHLAYLNTIEKLNCVYCGYANGLLGYAREIAGRTEQFWCPIKHARRVRAPHGRYHLFIDYGDAEGYHAELPRLRKTYGDTDGSDTRASRAATTRT